jgi:Fe-S-cluster containining protein
MSNRDDDEQDPVYGTADDSPVGRRDFERAIRALNASHVDVREAMLKLAAHVVSLTDELTRRLDNVEPHPAAPGTPANQSGHTVEETVAAYIPHTLDQIRARDTLANQRVSIDTGGISKYEAEGASPPCAELMPICEARCCTLSFALSTEDLDEGVIRWDYGQPYLIRQRASDRYCVHNHPDSHGCTVHELRPRVCRVYDCRKDDRIWLDYEQRIPAPLEHRDDRSTERVELVELLERVTARRTADHFEAAAISHSFADAEPMTGPPPAPKKPLLT